MRVLVTRPQADAPAFEKALRRAGHEPVLSPALVMTVELGPPIDLTPFRAVLITSANAVRALAVRTAQRNVRVLCVGPASAEAARETGFGHVEISQGEGVAGLLTLAQTVLHAGHGPLFYPSARDVAGNLETGLTNAGFAVTRQVVYRMDLAERLSPGAEAALRENRVDVTTYFSARSVEGAQQAANLSGLAAQLKSLPAICLSKAVEAHAKSHHGRTLSAVAATEAAMVQAIDLARHSDL